MTKGNICFWTFFFCCRVGCLSEKLTSDSVVLLGFRAAALDQARLKFERFSLNVNVASEEFVLRRLRASPLIKPRLMPGWLEVKCVY